MKYLKICMMLALAFAPAAGFAGGEDSGVPFAHNRAPLAPKAYAGLPLGEPMLVFCGFYGDRMNQALNAMRRTGLRIPYKAMLTAANRGWRPAELFAELQKEHTAMTAKR